MALLSLVAKLGLDTTGFQQGINKAGKQASQFGSGLKATLAGAFGAGAMIAFAKDIAQTTNRIKDLSEQFNVTTDDVQNIDYAMRQSGLSFEDFGNAMMKVGAARKDAATTNKDLRASFESLGVTLEDLQNPMLSNQDILMKMAAKMREGTMTAAQQALVMDILGARAGKLANVLATLEGVQAPSLFSEEDIENIDLMTKELELFWRDVQIGAVESAKAVMDFGNDIYTFLTTIFEELSKNWKDLLNPFKRVQTVNKAIDVATEEMAQQMASREQEREKQKENRDKAKAADKKKREEELSRMGQLFETKPEKVKEVKQAAPPPMQQADQLGRIGAFSGGASNNVAEQVKKTTATLVEIKRVLEFKGIMVKDL